MRAVGEVAEVVALRVDQAGNPGAPSTLAGGLDFAKVTDVEVDAGAAQTIAAWYQVSGGTAGFASTRWGADGQPESARSIFAPYGSYDGFDLAWNPQTGSSLGVFHGSEAAALAEELARDGADGEPLALDGTGAAFGLYLPRASAHPEDAAWLVVATPDYAGVSVERIERDGWTP